MSAKQHISSLSTVEQVFDILAPEDGRKVVKGYSADKAFYFKVDISDVDGLSAACREALKVIPKGSLFGGVHCAAIAPSRKWSHKMVDSCKVSDAHGTHC
jgi:3-hydroxyacyl-CoA dehydrogenase